MNKKHGCTNKLVRLKIKSKSWQKKKKVLKTIYLEVGGSSVLTY
jgi:hypothetical protein